MRVLIVEDEPDIRELVRIALREEGYAVDTAANVTDGRVLAMTNEYDAMVFDVRLPDGNGMELVRHVRRGGRATPILMLTAQRASSDVVAGLDAGADDYLGKPFDVQVLKARVRALLRRSAPGRSDQIVHGDLVVNRLSRQALVSGQRLDLTAKEFAMLEYLALHADEVLTRTQLLEHVWERNRDPDSNVIDVHVSRVRAKLRRAGSSLTIATMRGVGFMLTAASDGHEPLAE